MQNGRWRTVAARRPTTNIHFSIVRRSTHLPALISHHVAFVKCFAADAASKIAPIDAASNCF